MPNRATERAIQKKATVFERRTARDPKNREVLIPSQATSLLRHCDQKGTRFLSELDLNTIRDWRSDWKVNSLVRQKRQGQVIGFFWFCERAGWLPRNYASDITRGLGRIQVSKAAGSAANSRIAAARSGKLPAVNYSESWSRSDNPVFVFGSLLTQHQFGEQNFQVGALNRPDFLNNFQSRIAADQSLFDGGRTKHLVRAAELTKNVSSEEVRRTPNRRLKFRRPVAAARPRSAFDIEPRDVDGNCPFPGGTGRRKKHCAAQPEAERQSRFNMTGFTASRRAASPQSNDFTRRISVRHRA